MTSPEPRRPPRPAAFRLRRIAAVAVFLFAVGSVERAEASCGDWLAGHDSTPGQVARDEGGPQPPCDSPSCRRSRDSLPAVPPAPSRSLDGPERWCRLLEELAARPPLCSLRPPEADPLPSDGSRLSVERPPRA